MPQYQWTTGCCLLAYSQPQPATVIRTWSRRHAFQLTGPNQKWKAKLRTALKHLLVPLSTSTFYSALITITNNQANKQKKDTITKNQKPTMKEKKRGGVFFFFLVLFFVDTIRVWVNNARVCYYWSFFPGFYSFYENVTFLLVVKIVQRYVQKHVIHTYFIPYSKLTKMINLVSIPKYAFFMWIDCIWNVLFVCFLMILRSNMFMHPSFLDFTLLLLFQLWQKSETCQD